MLLQRAGTGTIPPNGFIAPPWEVLAESWDSQPQPETQSVTLGPADITLGHHDLEGEDEGATDVLGHELGWDNEHPQQTAHVAQFRID